MRIFGERASSGEEAYIGEAGEPGCRAKERGTVGEKDEKWGL